MGLPENSLAFTNHVVVSFWSEMVQNGLSLLHCGQKVVSTGLALQGFGLNWFEVVSTFFDATRKWFQLGSKWSKVVSTGLALQKSGFNWFGSAGIWFKLVSIRAAQSRWFGIRRQSGGPPDVQKEGPHTHAP